MRKGENDGNQYFLLLPQCFLPNVFQWYVSLQLDVRLAVEYMSFSAHADAKGIMQLISWCEPKNVMLVHGEAEKMDFLKKKIQHEFGM